MSRQKISKDELKTLKSIMGKRAKIVVEHILSHGSITTNDLKEKYGYDHPPRAIRDVLDQGIPLERTMVRSQDGRRMAEYRFGDLSKIQSGRIGGRVNFSKEFKRQLVAIQNSRCALCNAELAERYLQIDHRVPYAVAEDDSSKSRSFEDYMLVCGSCNRAKSWSCEHCDNCRIDKTATICGQCYWVHPLQYTHIALRDIRRLDLVWTEAEVPEFDAARKNAKLAGQEMPDYVKKAVRRALEGR